MQNADADCELSVHVLESKLKTLDVSSLQHRTTHALYIYMRVHIHACTQIE